MRVPGAIGAAGAIEAAAGAPLLVVFGGDRGLLEGKGRRGYSGNTDLLRLLGEDVPFQELHLGKNLRQLPWTPDLSRFSCVLNLVTDPDQNPHTLDNLRKLLRGYRGKVLNHPEVVLRSGRDHISALLSGTPGLTVPRAMRLRAAKPEAATRIVERSGMRFPLIVRIAGTHTGKVIAVVASLEELASAYEAGREHIVTEFVDFKSRDGLYRKCRVYFFGQRTIFRHMLISDDWNVHVSVRERFMGARPKLLEEEARLFARPEGAFPAAFHAVFQQVRRRMALDYFGMDFGIGADGLPVFFEANATMSFFPVDHATYPYLRRCIAPARQAFRAMVENAIQGTSAPYGGHA